MFHVGDGCTSTEALDDVQVGLPKDFPAIDTTIGLSNEGPRLVAQDFLAHRLRGNEGLSEFFRARLGP